MHQQTVQNTEAEQIHIWLASVFMSFQKAIDWIKDQSHQDPLDGPDYIGEDPLRQAHEFNAIDEVRRIWREGAEQVRSQNIYGLDYEQLVEHWVNWFLNMNAEQTLGHLRQLQQRFSVSNDLALLQQREEVDRAIAMVTVVCDVQQKLMVALAPFIQRSGSQPGGMIVS